VSKTSNKEVSLAEAIRQNKAVNATTQAETAQRATVSLTYDQAFDIQYKTPEFNVVQNVVLALIAALELPKIPSQIVIISRCLAVIIEYMCMKEEAYQELYRCAEYPAFLERVFLKDCDESVQTLVMEEIILLGKIFEHFHSDLMDIVPAHVYHLCELIQLLPSPHSSCPHVETYFNTVKDLLERPARQQLKVRILLTRYEEGRKVHWSMKDVLAKLARSFFERLRSGVGGAGEDKQLAGYLDLYNHFAECAQNPADHPQFEGEVVTLLCDELFGAEGAPGRPRRCATESLLSPSLALLKEQLRKKPEMFATLWIRLAKFHSETAKYAMLDMGQETKKKAIDGYVGLKNLGCTCYLNSLLQQLFMMPHFRAEILKLEAGPLEKAKCDRVVPNLQRIFQALQSSQQQFYTPIEFCNDFKDTDGKPINVFIQQDVDEFFKRLIDKLETEQKLLSATQIQKDIMEIAVTQTITSTEPSLPDTSSHDEAYLSIMLDIKGRRTLSDALDAFTKKEALEGDNAYFSSVHKRNVRATRQCLLKKLPMTVFMTLKRFEYELHTGLRHKVNDYFEFPEHVNFYKWTLEGYTNPRSDNPKEYDYDLVGIVVHSGTAEGGHYYSYIMERDPKSANVGKWFEFNDTYVDPFNVTNLRARTFGEEPSTQSLTWRSGANAYLLLYEKAQLLEPIIETLSPRTKQPQLVANEDDHITSVRMVSSSSSLHSTSISGTAPSSSIVLKKCVQSM
jgi:ubiquitin C-terminal hydrolase